MHSLDEIVKPVPLSKLRAYFTGKNQCPIVAIPFEDGTKLLFRREFLNAALNAPTINQAHLHINGTTSLVLHGPKAKYRLVAEIIDPKNRCQPQMRQVRQEIEKWAASKRKQFGIKAQVQAGVPRKLIDALAKLECELAKQFRGREPRPPINPLIPIHRENASEDYLRDRESSWKRGKRVRKALSKLSAQKRAGEVTWKQFYARFAEITGRLPFGKHTDKKVSESGRKFAFMLLNYDGRNKPYSRLDGTNWPEAMANHAMHRQEFLSERREYETLQSLIEDKRSQIARIEAEEGLTR